MNHIPNMNRRSFVLGAAAVGGGLALGLDLPLAARQLFVRPMARLKSTPGS